MTLILLFPVIAYAKTCSPDDINCKIEQLQLQAIISSGVKPTKVVETPPPVNSKKKDPEDTKSKPFKIPIPITIPTTQQTTHQDTPTDAVDLDRQDNENQANDSIPEMQPQQQELPLQSRGILYR
jgi:hypothetical protein